MDHLCVSRSVPSATDLLLHPLPTASNASLLSQSISPTERGFPRIRESLLCFSSPTLGSRSHPTSSPPPSPFFFSVLPSYAGIFIVLSGVQGLLLVFSWCSQYVRIVASVDVFLMHPWREMNSTSSYSSAILTLPPGSKNIRFWRGAIQPLKFLKITKQILSSVYSATIHISVSISVNKIGKWVQVVCVN